MSCQVWFDAETLSNPTVGAHLDFDEYPVVVARPDSVGRVIERELRGADAAVGSRVGGQEPASR